MIKTGILTISDRASKGEYSDKSGEVIKSGMEDMPAQIIKYEIIPDEPEIIKQKFIEYCDSLKADLVISTGGTGLGPRDFTPEATGDIIEKEVPGISEAIRMAGFKSTKNAMLSRGISGIRGKTLIINFPGSPRACREALSIILEPVKHALEMIQGRGH
jgi:molybdenum cofactor synthesis domain-containing protein